MAPVRARGTVYLVGAGPGDPDLISVRGSALLQRAGLVIADALSPVELVNRLPPEVEVVRFGRLESRGRDHQSAINRLMIARARRGTMVVRLKGGDPFIFGRGGEEAEALQRAGIRFEVIPGITAALGAAAGAGIPLTDRRLASSVALATAHVGGGREMTPDWGRLAGADTLVIYMGVRRLQRTADGLIAAGRAGSTPAALIRWATRPDQQVVSGTLRTIARRAREARLDPPALLVVGEVVRLRSQVEWCSRRPLAGRTIVVTRAREQAAEFSQRLREAGARVIEAPAIALVSPATWGPVDRALKRLADYDYLIFTSVNGVERFFERLRTRKVDVRDLHGSRVVAIGPATAAAVEARGLRVEAVAAEYRAEGLVRLLGGKALEGTRVLIPRATQARDLLIRALRSRGARVDMVPVYRTVASRRGQREVEKALRAGSVDLLTFTSSSTVTHFVRRFRTAAERRRLRSVPAGVIGPITAATARKNRLRVALMPREYTVPCLAAAIERRLGRTAAPTWRRRG